MRTYKLFLVMFLLMAFYVDAAPVMKISGDAGKIQAEITFGAYQLGAFNEKYTNIHIPGLLNLQSPGKPAIPFYPVRILLPPAREVKDVIVTGVKDVVAGNFRVRPASVPIPWFLQEDRGKLAVEDGVYGQRGFFPGNLYSPWIITSLAGYQIVSFNVYPVQYDPASGQVQYYSKLDITINLNSVRTEVKVHTDYESRIRSLVGNPDVARAYNTREYTALAEQEVPYVIVTSQALLNTGVTYSFEYFVDFLKSKGVNAQIATVEDIYAKYPGKDNPERVRNFIKYAFDNWHTRYVLLGGDADKGSEVVPVRRFKTDIHYVYMDGTSLTIHELMAADYYYSALDGDFDANLNGYYGEPEDNIDLEPEVAVGRAAVDNKTQLNNFIRKTIQAYNQAEQAAAPCVLMLGEHLFSPGQCGVNRDVYGDSFMNELLLGANTHGFHTNGFNDQWSVKKLYDKEQSWGSTEIKQALNTFGACWINHIGHSSPGYNMRLYRSSIASLTNDVPFLYYSQGCNAARFTNESVAPTSRETGERLDDCFAEYLTYSEHGAFAVIANWSYGLSPEDPETSDGDTPGASQYFHRWFVDAFFNPSVNLFRIGDMLSYSKAKMNSWLLDPNMQPQPVRWVYYELNLLGDPHAPLPKR